MKISVVGAGVMGPGIAQVFLMGGHQVTLTDISEKALENGSKNISYVLEQMYEKGIIKISPEKMMEQLTLTTELKDAVCDASVVVEAIPERLELKKNLYQQLDQYCKEDAIIASNTSSLPLPEIFPDFRKGNFCVAHFFNPPPLIPLVELVKNDDADEKQVALLKEILESCGKTVVVLNKFVKGFLINRLQTALSREAMHLFEENVVSAEDLDKAVRASIGYKSVWQGFFETLDYIGLDTVKLTNEIIFPDLFNGTAGSELVVDMVNKGKLGVKTGEGFYKYNKNDLIESQKDRTEKLLEQLKLWNRFETE